MCAAERGVLGVGAGSHGSCFCPASAYLACVLPLVFLPQVRRTFNIFLEGSTALKPSETESNNRSVMPLDALGRTRATMPGSAGVFPVSRETGNPLKAPACL